MLRIIILVIISSCLAACCEPDENLTVSGRQPVYLSYGELLQYSQLPPQPIIHAGKILVYGNLLFTGETNAGIHIIDISDTLNPVKLSYLKIPGCKDFSAQNDRLYADNGPHLLTLDIHDIAQVTLVQRQMNFFQPSEYYPANYNGSFECVDYSKGWVIGWQTAQLSDPKCQR